MRRGLIATSSAALLAALAGIGGALIYVPSAVRVMRMPHWLAVPAAQLLVAVVASVVVVFHAVGGNAGDPIDDVAPLALDFVVAVPAGRWLGQRLGEGLLMRLLAVGLLAVGTRTALEAI